MDIQLLAVIAVIVLLFLAGVFVAKKNAAKRLKIWRDECKIGAQFFLRKIKSDNKLNSVATNFMLKKGERAYFSGPADLYETRSVSTRTGSYTGVRVMKGVYIGGSRGTTVSTQVWTCIASGNLAVTNQRLVFDGDKNDRNILLKDVFNAESTSDGVQISCENRQKSMIFACQNPIILAMIIRICCQAPDVENLEGVNLQIEIV